MCGRIQSHAKLDVSQWLQNLFDRWLIGRSNTVERDLILLQVRWEELNRIDQELLSLELQKASCGYRWGKTPAEAGN